MISSFVMTGVVVASITLLVQVSIVTSVSRYDLISFITMGIVLHLLYSVRFVFFALSRWDVFLTITFHFEPTCTTTTSTCMTATPICIYSTCTTCDLLVFAILSVVTYCQLDLWTWSVIKSVSIYQVEFKLLIISHHATPVVL